MQEHEKFGAPPKLRPRTAGASRSSLLPPNGIIYGTSTSAPERLANSVNALQESPSFSLRQRLASPRPGSAAPQHTPRAPEVTVDANTDKGIFMKPPMRPKSANAASRQVSRHRMQLMQDPQESSNQHEEMLAQNLNDGKEDALREGVESMPERKAPLVGKRPFSASAAPFFRSGPSPVSNQSVGLLTTRKSAAGIKRPHSAAATVRYRPMRARDKSESGLSDYFSVTSFPAKTPRSGSAASTRSGQSRGDRLLASTREHIENTFVYAVPRHFLEAGLPYDPYDITPIAHETLFGTSGNNNQVQNARWDYYTISRSGYTFHVKSDNFQSTFLSLGDWETQRSQFTKLRSLLTFSEFRYRKVFMNWRQYVRTKRRQAARDVLLSESYFSYPELLGGVQEIRVQLDKIAKRQLMWDFDGETCSLERFTSANEQYLLACSNELQQLTANIQQILVRVCRAFLDDKTPVHASFPGNEFALSVRKSSNFHIFENYVQCEHGLATAHQQFMQHKHLRFSRIATSGAAENRVKQLLTTVPESGQRRVKTRPRLKAKEDDLDDIRWTMAAIRRRKCKQLTKLMTLVDFLLLDAFSGVVKKSLDLLHDFVLRGANAATISRLSDHDDLVLATHQSIKTTRRNLTQASGEGSDIAVPSQSRHTSQRYSSLSKQQIKTLLRAAWGGKLKALAASSVAAEISSSTSITTMESKLEALVFDALNKRTGTNTDDYSVDDLLFVAEKVIGHVVALPPFSIEGRSIYSTPSEKESKAPTTSPPLELEVLAIPCISPRPLFTLGVGTSAIAEKRASRRRSYQICFIPERAVLVRTLQTTITGFTDAFRGVSPLLSSPELRAVLEFAEDIRALTLHSAFTADGSHGQRDSRSTAAFDCPEDSGDEDDRFRCIADRLVDRVQDDTHYLSARDEIEDLARSALQGAEALESCYAEVLELRHQNEGVDFEVKAKLFRRDQYKLDEMKDDATHFTEQLAALQTLVLSTNVEFLNFDMQQLQAELLPSPARCLDAMRELLPRLAREKCDQFLQYIHVSSAKIEKPVTRDLDAFTTYLLNLRDVHAESLDKECDLTFLGDFFAMIKRLRFVSPIETLKTFELCEPEFQVLKSNIQEAYANRDSDIQTYAPLLAENLTVLSRWMSSLQSATNDQALAALSSSCQDARDSAVRLFTDAKKMQQEARRLEHIQKVFEDASSDARPPGKTFKDLDTLSTELKLKSELWEAVCEADEHLKTCSSDTLQTVDLDKLGAVASHVDGVVENIRQSATQMTDSFELDRLEKLQATLHGLAPVIRDLRNPHFVERHWSKLEHKMQCSLEPINVKSTETHDEADDSTTTESSRLDLHVQQLLDVNAVAHATTIRHVSEEATAEAAIAGSFMKVVKTWEETDIPVVSKKDRDGRDVHCVGDCVELSSLIEESQVLLKVMDLSTYSLVVQDRLPKMISDLEHTKKSLELLQICQHKWDYIQRLVSVDFARTFPEQAKKLQKHDTSWRTLTHGLFNRSLCLPFGVSAEHRHTLQIVLEGFELTVKTLADHLEIKRQIFPAFFQLSDFELAILLSKCRDVTCISSFLYQSFDNVGTIVFGTRDTFQDILQVTSRAFGENEIIPMGKNLKARGPVEQWLAAVEKRLAEQLRRSTKQTLEMLLHLAKTDQGKISHSSRLDVGEIPVQCVLLADRIVRCTIIESGLRDLINGGSYHVEKIGSQLAAYTTSVNSHLLSYPRINMLTIRQSAVLLSPREITLKTGLCVQEIHFRDALASHESSHQSNSMLSRTSGGLAIDWEYQLKYRMDDTTTVGHECHVEMNTLSIPYGFNYLNPVDNSVVTPGSLRSLFSLFACIRHAQGCVLVGPSQSGKRTLTMQVGAILGRRTFTAAIATYTHATRLLIGALYAGGTFCARVDMATHSSAIATLIKTLAATIAGIEHAVLTKNSIWGLHRSPITFTPGTAMFLVTRSNKNLCSEDTKQLRAWTEPLCHIAIVQWDQEYILEALLYSKGFVKSHMVSKQLLVMWNQVRAGYDRVRKNSSSDDENPFRFSALKFALADAASHLDGHSVSRLSEIIYDYQWALFFEAIRRYFRLRIDDEGLKLLENVLGNTSALVLQNPNNMLLMPNKKTEEPFVQESLQECVLAAVRQLKFVPRRVLINSVLSLAMALTSNVSAVLVGSSGVGKSTSYQVLARALELWFQRQDPKETPAQDQQISDKSRPLPSPRGRKRTLTNFSNSFIAKPDRPPSGRVVVHVVLPMSLTVSQLYGGVSPDDHGRIPSILGRYFREAQEVYAPETLSNRADKSESGSTESLLNLPNQVWIVFDDALDMRWLEGILAVLSNPKQLVAPLLAFEDGEFMTLPPTLRLVFEVLQLRDATPTFLHLNGIIPVNTHENKPMARRSTAAHLEATMDISTAYLHRYFTTQRDKLASNSSELPDPHAWSPSQAFDVTERWLLQNSLLAEMSAVLDAGRNRMPPLQRIINLTSMLQALLSTVSTLSDMPRTPQAKQDADAETPKDFAENISPGQIRVEMALVYSLLWGFAASSSDQPTVQRQVSDVLRREFEHLAPAWLSCGSDVNLFDTLLDLRELRFIPVVGGPEEFALPPQGTSSGGYGGISSLFLPTTSSLLVHFAIKEALRSGRGVLLLGGDSSRRTTLARNFLGQLEVIRSIINAGGVSDFLRANQVSGEDVETPHNPVAKPSDESTTLASVKRLRLRQITLVTFLARRLQKSSNGEASQPVREVPATSTNGTENAKTLMSTTEDEEGSPLAIAPTTDRAKMVMVHRFDRGDVIPFFFAMPDSISSTANGEAASELAGCLERMLQRERTGVFEPPPGKTAMLILDDLHLAVPAARQKSPYPSVDAFLRSVHEHGTVYRSSNCLPTAVENLMMLATTRVGSSYSQCQESMQKLTSRFFPVLAPTCGLEELHNIFGQTLQAHWATICNPSTGSGGTFTNAVRHAIPLVIAATTILWDRLRAAYCFRLQDLARVYEGIAGVGPSLLPDVETLLRLWTHECSRTLREPTIGTRSWSQDDRVAQEISQMRMILSQVSQRRASARASRMSLIPAANLNISMASKRLSVVAGASVIEEKMTVAANLALFAARSATAVTSTGIAHYRRLSEQQGSLQDQQHRDQMVGGLWAFVPAGIYYSGTSISAEAHGGRSNSKASGELEKQSHRRSSASFMRQRSLQVALIGDATIQTHAKLEQWVYAEISFEDDTEVVSTAMMQPYFENIRVFSSTATTSNLWSSSKSLPRDVSPVPFTLAQTLTRIDRVFARPGARLVLLQEAGSAADMLLRYSNACRSPESQEDSIFAMSGEVEDPNTSAGVSSCLEARWKRLLVALYERVGVAGQEATLEVKRLDLLPPTIVNQVQALMTTGEVPGTLSLEEQVHIATRVCDERLLELKAKHAEQVAQIRAEVEATRTKALASLHHQQRESSTTPLTDVFQQVEFRYQRELRSKLARVDLRWQQDTDDLRRTREVESESVAATVMALTRPLGVTSGKWSSAVARMRSKLRVVLLVDKEHEHKVHSAHPNIFTTCDVVSVPKLDRNSLRTLVHGHFHAQVRQLLQDHSNDDKCHGSEEGGLVGFLLQVQRSLWTVSCMATDMHLSVIDAFSTTDTGGEDKQVSPPVVRAFAMASIFAKLLVHGYEREEAARSKASWFLDLSNRLDRDLGALRSSDTILSEQLATLDQQIKHHEATLIEKKQDAERIRAIMQRFQLAADEQVLVTNEAQELAKKELQEPMACLEEANHALLLVDKRHIVEIKSFVNPPPMVHLVLGAVCILFQLDPSWESARRLLLGDANVVQTLLQFNKDAVPTTTLAKLEAEYLRDERFTREEVERQSVAAASMVGWVRAIHQYATARKQVQPTLDKLEKAQNRLQMIMKEFQVSKQRVVEADEAWQAAQAAIDGATSRKQVLSSEISSLEARCGSGGLAMAALQEDRKHQQEAASASSMRRGFSLTTWNTLLSAGNLAYACELTLTRRRQQIFQSWESAYRRYGGLTPGVPPTSTKCEFMLSIAVVPKDPDDEDTSKTQSQDDTPLMALFAGDQSRPGDIEADDTEKLITGIGLLCFSRRRLWDASLLSLFAVTPALPVVMITRYSSDLEELLVCCARRVWHWHSMHMVYARAKDFYKVFRSAVREGHQLLVLDVEPTDVEPRDEADNGVWLHAAIAWKSKRIDDSDHLPIPRPASSTDKEVTGEESAPANVETIEINPNFRLILTSHTTREAFGEALDMVPTLDAHLHTSDIADVLLDKIWSSKAADEIATADDGGFTLKTALRDYGRLARQFDVSHAQLTKLLEASAVASQFPLSQTQVLRERLAAIQESRQALRDKRREIREQISLVKRQAVPVARTGGAVFNAFNNVVSGDGKRSSPPLSLPVFLPMLYEALKSPPPALSAVLTTPSTPTTPLLKDSSRQSSTRRVSALVRTATSFMLRTSSHQLNAFEVPSHVLGKLLLQIAPLMTPTSINDDWYRFLVRVIISLENVRAIPPNLKPKPVEETEEKEETTPAPRSLETLLLQARIAGGGKCPPAVRPVTAESCREMSMSSFQSDLQRRVVSIIFNGCKPVSSGDDVDALMSSLLPATPTRLERLRVGLMLFPEFVRHVCDRMLAGYGVPHNFHQHNGGGASDNDPNESQGLWLRAIKAMPEETAVLVLTRHEFHSFGFARRIFFLGMNNATSVQARVLQELAHRTFRAAEEEVPTAKLATADAQRVVSLTELYHFPRYVRPSEKERDKADQQLVLMANNFEQIAHWEKTQLEALEAAPLAVVDMKYGMVSLGDWDALFQILYRSCHQTNSLAFQRHNSSSSRGGKAIEAPPKNQPLVPANSGTDSTSSSGNMARRTSQSMIGRLSAADLVTPSYPRFVAAVDGWRALPIHQRTNILCLRDEFEEEEKDGEGDVAPPSFSKLVQSTILRLVLYPSIQTLSSLTQSTEDDSEMVPGYLSDAWQMVSGLVLFHAILRFRERTLRTAFPGALPPIHHPAGTGTTFYYSDDSFLTAINQILVVMADKQQHLNQRRRADAVPEKSEILTRRLHQQVVLSSYTRVAAGCQELEFLRRLFHECLQHVRWDVDSSGSKANADLRARGRQTTARDNIRGSIAIADATSSLQGHSMSLVTGETTSSSSALLGFLSFPSEELKQNHLSFNQWLELVWSYSAGIDNQSDAKLQTLVFGMQTQSTRRKSIEGSSRDLVVNAGCLGMIPRPLPQWMRGFGWTSEQYAVLSGDDVELTAAIPLRDVVKMFQEIVSEVLPSRVDMDPADTAVDPTDLAVEHARQTIAAVYNQHVESCSLVFETIITRLFDFEQQNDSEIKSSEQLQEEDDDDGHESDETSSTEDSDTNQHNVKMLHLSDIEDESIRQQATAILRNEVPQGLLPPNSSPPPVAPSWSLHDVLQHYQDWREFLAQPQHHNDNFSKWWLPGVLASGFPVSHIVNVAVMQHQNRLPSRQLDSVNFTLRLHRNDGADSTTSQTAIPESTFAVIDGVVLVGATWNEELQCLDKMSDVQLHQRVQLACYLAKSADSPFVAAVQNLRNPKQTSHLPLISSIDGSLLLECPLAVGAHLGPLATPFLVAMGSHYR